MVWIGCDYICNKFNAQSKFTTMPVQTEIAISVDPVGDSFATLVKQRDELTAELEQCRTEQYRLLNLLAKVQNKRKDAETQSSECVAEVLDLRGLVSLLGPAVGNLCNESAFAHLSDDELYLLIPSPAGDMAKHLLEAREAFGVFLSYNTPEAEQTSDDYEPVGNWRPERDI